MNDSSIIYPRYSDYSSTSKPAYPKQGGIQGCIEKSILSQADMVGISDCWDRLDQNKIEDNIYYTRKYTQALLNNLPQRNEVFFATAWQDEELIGLLPFTKKRFRVPYFMPWGTAWITPYTFTCLPVLDKKNPVSAAKGILRSLANLGISDWQIRDFYLSGPTQSAFLAALDETNIVWHEVPKYQRAMFNNGPDFDQHVKEFVPKKRRRDLARNRRRLEELGTVTHEVHTEGKNLELAVQAFLDLEKSGWKGKRGTALACREDTTKFAKDVFCASPSGRVRADLLLLDGRPIAAGMMVFDGHTSFTIKGAYDEDFHKYSVGLLLEMMVAESFLAGDWAKKLDSATAGQHVIDFLWPERQSVGDLYFSFKHNATKSHLERFEYLDGWKSRCKNKLKQLIGR